MSQTSTFNISVDSERVVADVRLNEIPLCPKRAGTMPWHLSLNEYLVEGVNTVSVTLSPSTGTEPRSAHVEIRENGTPIIVLTYPPALDPPDPLPLTIEDEFEFATAIGPRAWEQGAPINAANGAPATLIGFLQQVGQTLGRRDLEGAVALFSVRARDIAKVFGLDAEEQIARQREYFEGLFRDPFWGMQPVDASRVRVRYGAGARIALIDGTDGGDPLRSVPDAEGITNYFPVAVSLIGGKWAIVL